MRNEEKTNTRFPKTKTEKGPTKERKMGENQPSSSRLLRLIFMSVAIAKGIQAIITNGPKIVKFLLHFFPSFQQREREMLVGVK